MPYVKFQIGCLLVILYVVVAYIRERKKSSFAYNRLFDLLMFVAPWAVFFDGLTSWTVNHMDVVPEFWNRSAHLLFFVFMDLSIIVTTLYMYEQLVGFYKQHKTRNLLMFVPGALSVLLIIAGIGQLYYIDGKTTFYSMGFSVYICYGSLILHYGMILFLMFARRRFIAREKVVQIMTIILVIGAFLLLQIFNPESLVSAIFPTLLVLGIYVEFENPSIRKLTTYNEKMVESFATLVESRDNNTGDIFAGQEPM